MHISAAFEQKAHNGVSPCMAIPPVDIDGLQKGGVFLLGMHVSLASIASLRGWMATLWAYDCVLLWTDEAAQRGTDGVDTQHLSKVSYGRSCLT